MSAATKPSWRDFWQVHPSAECFPLMKADELRKLADDIDGNGLKVAIETRSVPGPDGGKDYVIDGRNRLDAMELLGLRIVDENGRWIGVLADAGTAKKVNHRMGKTDKEIATEVIGLNIRRRHLTKQEQVELIDRALRAMGNNDSANMARSFNPVPGERGGSTKDRHKAAVVIEAAKHGISKRTVERTLPEKDKPDTPDIQQPNRRGRKVKFPKMAKFKRAITNLKNSILWSDAKDTDGRWASDLLIDLTEFLKKHAARLVKERERQAR